MEIEGFHRYLLEQRKGMQQLIIISHVLADEVNLGYHGMGNLLLTSVNGHRPANMRHLVDILVKSDIESTLEFRCTSIHSTRAKIGEPGVIPEYLSSHVGIISHRCYIIVMDICSSSNLHGFKKSLEFRIIHSWPSHD
jgi:hypothetical protein